MNSKERMFNLFNGKEIDMIPAAPHWWGLYKFQLAGIAAGYENEHNCWKYNGQKLADVDALFYETFKPDWFHLSCGYSGAVRDEYKEKKARELKQRVKELESKSVIDEYLELVYMTENEIKNTHMYDHVKILSSKYGDEVFIAMNEGNPICGVLDPHGTVGFEEGLVALIKKPDLMEYLIFREYELMLEKIKVLKEYGCHGYIGSETYCTPDLISPNTYRDLIFPAQKYFYKKVGEMGIVPIVYFLGDIIPLISYINKLGAAALLVEEPKKTFSLDIVEIRQKLAEDITLFGNLDSIYTLLHGTREDVVAETKKQLEAANYGRFVMANGCPIAFYTPKENIEAMIETAHKFDLMHV